MALSFRHWITRPASATGSVPAGGTEATGVETQFQNGVTFATGLGVVRDFAQAAHWYAQAAERNHSTAQFNLATLYARGLGVVKDAAKSLMWLTRAAMLGNAAAQYTLGVREHLASRPGQPGANAEGRIEALKWVRLSAAQGYQSAESACEFVALGMTLQEVAESARRSGAFVAG